jgi:hypothetical protein
MVGEDLQIGGLVLCRDRQYVMRGFSRMSLDSRQYVDLEDPDSGERVTMPADEVFAVPLPPPDDSGAPVIPLRP